MLPQKRRPTHPGEILKYEFLEPLKMSQKQLADAIDLDSTYIKELIQCNRSLTPDIAFRLAKYFNTSAEFWMNLQINLDMWETLQSHKNEYERIASIYT